MTNRSPRGTWGTVLLPIQSDDSIDYAALGEELHRLVEARLDGVYTNGTAGEFHGQTESEFDRVHALVADKCGGAGLRFQIGVSHMSAQISLERLRRSRSLGAAAFQVILPDWVAVSDEEAEAFLRRMAEAASPVPLVLYNPPHAKRVLDLPAIARLREAVPSLVGIKVLDGGASWYAAVRHRLPDFSVFVPGHHLASGFLHGVSGSYSNVACLSPRGAQLWWERIQQDPLGALETEKRILAFFHAHVVPFAARGFSNPALDKLLAAIGGWTPLGTRIRWPYRSIDPSEAQRLGPIARRMIPELFER